MDITISFSSILQIFSLIFMAGGIYAWVKYKIDAMDKKSSEQGEIIELLREDLHKQNNFVKDVQHASLTRDEAYKSFVAKEMMELHVKNIEKNINEIKDMLSRIHTKRATDN